MGREVGEVLWPGLSQVLESARIELDTLVTGLRRDCAGVLRDRSRLALQEELATRTRRAGWCLGVLAAAQGVDLLHGRREAEGLRWMVAALIEARAFTSEPPATELPRIPVGSRAAWDVSLLATWCALQVGQSSNGIVRWWTGEDGADKWLAFESEAAHTARTCAARPSSAWTRPRLGLATGRLVTWQ